MKVYIPVFLLMILANHSAKSQSDPISAFQLKWANSKDYLMDIAERMPDESYGFKPTERQMSFNEQLLHIRRNMLWLSHEYIAETEWVKTDLNDFSEPETKQLLADAFDTVSLIVADLKIEDLSEEVAFKGEVKTKLQILNLIQDHATHHRGQVIVYLNLLNIEPPSYIGW